VMRDRNHPSIIQWSMCNEEGLQGSEDGARIFKAMKEATLALDPTRPITCAMNGGWGSGITFVEDLQGINYAPGAYAGFHEKFPDMPLYGSETASAVSTRGEYVNDRQKGYVSAYDVNAPPWAQPAEVAWKAIGEREYVAGGYVWTGFDYKGEPTPYGWPCINSHFGIMDECGFPKDTYYYYLSWWGEKPVAHILPHWNWPGEEGKVKDVWVHSNAERVELFLNGTSLGAKDMPRLGHLQWSVPYAPGKLEARGYKGDKVIVTDVVETTGKATQLRLKPDRKTMTANGEEVILVETELLDDKGRVVPDADNEVTFEVTGAAHIGGVGNGDPSSHEPDKANKRHAFHGLCMVIVQAGETPGSVTVFATSPGLKPTTVRLEARK
jgi:beta-galactosidase